MQLAQLLLLNFGWCIGHDIARSLVLWKSDHLADVRLACQHHAQAIDSRRNSAMRWCAKLEGFQHVTKALSCHFRLQADQLEYLLLQLAIVNPDRPTANFVVIHHHVILLAARLTRISIQEMDVLRHR